MKKLALCLAAALLGAALSACGDIHGVSTAGSTNLQGAPGTANDIATGGRGNNIGSEGGGGGSGGSSGRN